MQNKLARQAFLDLVGALTSKRLLQKSGLTKKAVLSLLQKDIWTDLLGQLLPIRERLTCARITALFEPQLEAFSSAPSEGWMPFAYQFVRGLMYPDAAFAQQAAPYREGAYVYLTLLQLLFDYERRALPFDPQMDFRFVPEEDLAGCDHAQDYRRFLEVFRLEYIYELMRLGRETTPFSTLEHIAGVHHLAMTVSYGLRDAGVPVDLALISGAAAGHDLGKYGCKPNERVPYLHYYYTDKWFLAREMAAIGHIAANHSTWDLELENLSVESLALIYADFRVKQSRGPDGRELTTIYPLDASFEVILEKLDNVDDAKKRRYTFVYDKLHDFEDYIQMLGVNVTLAGPHGMPLPRKDAALMNADEVIRTLTLLSVEHNLSLMHRFSSERRFGNLLEAARSEKHWERMRAYLNIFEEYSTHLSANPKIQVLSFLYELLMHREGDIRRQAAALIGTIIARFRMGYRKELPEGALADPGEQTPFTLWAKYLDLLIYPDHKITSPHRSRIGYALKIMVGAALECCRPEDVPRFLDAFLHYFDHLDVPADSAFALLDALHHLPFDLFSDEMLDRLTAFAIHHAATNQLRLTTAAMRFLARLTGQRPAAHPCCIRAGDAAQTLGCDGNATLTFLQHQILSSLGLDASSQAQLLAHPDTVRDIFLDNLKSATPWIIKAVNIELLIDRISHNKRDNILHIAAHLSNLIRISEWVVVRHEAGAALLRLMPLLTLDQRNEIAVELAKGLEVGGYGFSKYIPDYLGEIALYLHPKELDELLFRLKELLGSANSWIVSVALGTLGIILRSYPEYRSRFDQPSEAFEARRRTLIGLLLDGLASPQESVREEALLVLGKTVFGADRLPTEEKTLLFSLCCKKLLFLISENPGTGLAFFYRASALSHIYRFIALYRLDHGGFCFESGQKVAFFPGTFDPFTLSHKGIVQAIRDLGFEVFLAIDEFSWSKKSQPRLIRRQIVSMSVADEFHVHLFPDDVPVNIANPADLKCLRELFPNHELYIVVGSDVVCNASSYRLPPEPDSIHSLNHIVFRRVSGADDDNAQTTEAYALISGKVVELTLPAHLEDISSTRIRENIDLNRDISNLVDPTVQEFIYQNSLYLREPQYKPVISADSLLFERLAAPSETLAHTLADAFLPDATSAQRLATDILRERDSVILIRHQEVQQMLGFATFRLLAPSELFEALRHAGLADYVRRHAAGQILLITGVYARSAHGHDLSQLLLAEVLTDALAAGCGYTVFLPHAGLAPAPTRSALERQGFFRAPVPGEEHLVYVVDMRAPMTVIQNLETTIKEPFCHSERVLTAVHTAHERLQMAMTDLYPGNLVLSLSAGVIHHRLVGKITALNEVPSVQTVPRRLGKNMCVPFGKIMRGKVAPNTVTKTLHTDKVFAPDIHSSTIEAFPYYSPIESQIRTIKSFNRPVILVDDLLHGGDRIQALDPLFRKDGIRIKKVLVGLMSGRGKDLMALQGHPVDCVYFVPNLRRWFVESTLYPFIGGDTVRRGQLPVPGLLPSINRIMPYATPEFAGECTLSAMFELSRCCIENARDILLALEAEYRELFARNLTLNRLSEAVILPLCPDKGGCLSYDPNLAASVYLQNDLEMLLRTRELML